MNQKTIFLLALTVLLSIAGVAQISDNTTTKGGNVVLTNGATANGNNFTNLNAASMASGVLPYGRVATNVLAGGVLQQDASSNRSWVAANTLSLSSSQLSTAGGLTNGQGGFTSAKNFFGASGGVISNYTQVFSATNAAAGLPFSTTNTWIITTLVGTNDQAGSSAYTNLFAGANTTGAVTVAAASGLYLKDDGTFGNPTASGTLTIRSNGTVVASGVTNANFVGAFQLIQNAAGDVTISNSASSTASGGGSVLTGYCLTVGPYELGGKRAGSTTNNVGTWIDWTLTSPRRPFRGIASYATNVLQTFRVYATFMPKQNATNWLTIDMSVLSTSTSTLTNNIFGVIVGPDGTQSTVSNAVSTTANTPATFTFTNLPTFTANTGQSTNQYVLDLEIQAWNNTTNAFGGLWAEYK